MSKKNNVVANLRANPVLSVLSIFLVLSLVALALSAFKIQKTNENVQRFLKSSDDLRSANYRLVDAMRSAVGGAELSFDEANETLSDMAQLWGELDGPNNIVVMHAIADQSASARDAWNRLKLDGDTVYKNKDILLQVNDISERLKQTIPQIQEQYDAVGERMLQSGASAQDVASAKAQSWLAERLARNIDKLKTGDETAEAAADQVAEDSAKFGQVLNATLQTAHQSSVTQSLNEVAALFKVISDSANSIAAAKQVFLESSQASNRVLQSDTAALLQELSNLNDAANDLPDAKRWNWIFVISAALSLLVMVLMATILLRSGSSRLHVQESENERNQTAILRLLDELADLADGDLTTTATVSEDFTGAIADSINFTIDNLRVLVSRINDTAVRVSSAAQETQGTALHLAEASDHQAQEIAGASAAVNEMAVTIDQVSANAAESAAVAERSVSIANKGAEVVQNTIQGMDNIRDQIQETSKRIKRLGESSQEIGDIVSLINDIADQTNILALNAAIQASMAGDAGRGFAVVADEVQRLAERSSAATKQIEALVKTIQTDTNEAVASMEQTTAEVVRGARLAQDAGVALEEIENVSTTLAEL
ncbi:MAG TPA: methyl-accepting chemotaxis protein, partial [Pseudomonadales bacterium]|nr:methyl-accepting chemotaxis protein [Pseudomonadales bacterium]